MRSLFVSLAFTALTVPAMAQSLPGTPAVEGTPEWLVGDGVLYFVGGRTREEAGNDSFNPFGIDPDSLLFHVGSFFVVSDFTGEPIKEGDLSIYPQYAMPRGEGVASAETPPIIPFALMQQGTCYGGYVTGFPVPDTTYAVDMTDALCHADTVDQMVHNTYEKAANDPQPTDPTPTEPTPTEPTPEEVPEPPVEPVPGFDPAAPQDAQLQAAVYAAYDAAYAIAVAHPNYEFWDGSDYAPVRDAIAKALADQGLAGIAVAADPVAAPADTRACADRGKTELRLAFTADRLGIAIGVASSRRTYGYEYDYAISPDLRTIELRDCATSGTGRAGTRSY